MMLTLWQTKNTATARCHDTDSQDGIGMEICSADSAHAPLDSTSK